MTDVVQRVRQDPVPPPPDRALPTLPTALSAAAMEEILESRLGSEVVLRACVPCYVRYKPQTNCIVQYRLTLEDAETGRIQETTAHLTLYAGGRAERIWSRKTLQELAAAAESIDAQPRLARAAHLPELDAVLQIAPVDAAIPALVFATSASGRRRVLEDVLGQVEADAGGVELLRYKPARKALLRYDAGDRALYAKLYARERGELLLRAGRALVAAGVPMAPPLAYLPSLRMLVHAEAPGRPLRTLVGTAEYSRGVRAAGEALAQLHAIAPAADLPPHSWSDEGAQLAASAKAVAVLRPDLAAEAATLADRVVEALGLLEPASTTLHGDFYDDQVLWKDEAALLLDFDEMQSGHPLLDVGNFLAHLSVRNAEDPARAAFLEGYGSASAEIALLVEAAAVLKLAVAPFRRLDPDWPAALERRVRLAAHRLDEYPPSRAPSRVRRIDPALPQLAVLRNPTLVGYALADVYGEPVEVTAAAIVRHKPGRRCTLRYDVLAGPDRQAERLYAKTFASDRGPRVHKSLKLIADARAFGPGALLPEPVAYVGRLKLLLQREVPGVPIDAGLLAGDRSLAARVAEVLAALHTSGIELGRRHEVEDELAVLRARVAKLARGGRRARSCLARLEVAAAAVPAWRVRPIHRDFYPDQLLLAGDRLGVLDLDDAAMSEPAVDVANFLAHLRLLGIEQPARAEAIGAAADAFRSRAHELDPALDPRLVRLLESATLLRLACIHELFMERLIDEAEALLPPPEAVRRPRTRRQTRLELALDGPAVLALVGDAVEAWAGVRPRECRPVLLRHKKRRAVVRYELEASGGPLAIVGMWFRDDRGAGVVDVLSALCERGFARGDFRVPAPLLHDPELHAVFTEAAAGPSLRSTLETNPTAAARAGAWLARYHSSGVALPGSRPPSALAGAALRWARSHPAVAPLADAVASALRGVPDPGRPVHYEYASADVLVPERGPTVVVDFDDAAMGDPALDVANFEATLMLRGWRRGGGADAFAAARDAFRAGYAEYAQLPPLAPAIEAAVWLRLARRELNRRRNEDIWRFAVDRAADTIARVDAP